MFTRLTTQLYQALMIGACIAMVMAFATIALGVVAREAAWNIPGLDAYAGYSIAAALFLALPATLKQGDHIRVTLLAQRLNARWRRGLEHFCLFLGVALSGYVAYFSCRLVWISWTTHDVSQGADATALWIPQTFMAIGAIGFTISFVDAWLHHFRGEQFFAVSDEAARVE
ncbi:MAG: TRAP transporter small permease subunit [Betaproteobacteria bacterium]|nr:MAG: TRAP transporter small permease subunit [Betaproteobacteria bacterium]